MWKAVYEPWTTKCYLKKSQFISCMANYQHTTGNLIEKLWEFTSRLSSNNFPKEEFVEKQTEDKRNYDWGNLLYPWELLVLNYYLNEARFPRRTTTPHDQIEIRVSISKSTRNTRRIRHSVINILKRLCLTPFRYLWSLGFKEYFSGLFTGS